LDVTPQITPEGMVKMEVLVKKEDPDWTRSVQGNPPIKSSVVETSVVVENGATLVIGGIYSNSLQNQDEKIPLLGDLPVIGNLFKHQQKTTARREVLIFITPRIVSGFSLNN
jgi:type IV pilus assembly protein PilQ